MGHIEYLRKVEDIAQKMDDVIREATYIDTKYETIKTQTDVYDFLEDMLAHVLPLVRECYCCTRLADSYGARHACFYTMSYLAHLIIERLEETKEKMLDVYPNLTELFVLCQELKNALLECNLTF